MESFSKDFDAIVVGTGPGGATVARELAKNHKKVLMLEWGDNAVTTGTKLQALKRLGIPGKGVQFTPNLFAVVRGITVGGSSLFYYATAFTPPLDVLNAYGIDISKEIEEVKQEIPVMPLKDELFGPMANRIMESALELGYPWERLPKFIYQDKCRSNCYRCNYGCPYGAKWTARMLVDEAVTDGATLLSDAKVQRVILENKKATGVVFRAKNKQHNVFAPKIIISAGGIGSPVILRASGIKGAGFDYFFDPLISVMGTVKDINGGKEIPMAAGHQFVDDGYFMTDMTIPLGLNMAFAAEVGRFDRMFSHSHTLSIMVKEKDSLGGWLTDSGGVKKKMADIDYKKLDHGYQRAKNILKNAGARHIYKSWYLAAHPGGTVKVGHLVDKNLQTEFENLYVCDASVIPQAWGLPPTFTILGLGKRLAKNLIGVIPDKKKSNEKRSG
jgi:choline dehydrogenase-like flavoprotein